MSSEHTFADNATLRTIHARHSIRMFIEKPVEEADVRELLHAANMAPSAHNKQSWRFLIIRDQKKHELIEMVNKKAAEFPRSASILLRMAARTMASAPVVVAVTNTGELIEHGQKLFGLDSNQGLDFLRTMEIQSSAAAVQNLLLAATALGLGSVWLGILFLIKDEVLQFLGEPKGEFMAVIPVGYAARETKGPEKQPIESTVKELS